MSRMILALIALWGICSVAGIGVYAEDKKPGEVKSPNAAADGKSVPIPACLDSRLKIELFADAPQIVTPTGIDVDSLGRVWAIESNTHFPPEGYSGHPTDRVLVMADTDADGKADKIEVFKDGLTHAMSIAVKPLWLDIARFNLDWIGKPAKQPVSWTNATEIYIATRRDIFHCVDRDGDGKCDEAKIIVRLETPGDYPHNGLGGFAFDALGYMYFGFGENLGANYKIIGSDKITLSGGAEGGSVYRCRPDGSKLERWSTGYWNPHASCFDAFGRMFTVDNDPDSRPPCRLLHNVQNGDYGFRFRYGRKGTHPFTSWNGEIPGTLPMVSGTGEAPSGIVAYESDGLPDDYRGTLLVGSWGDHRIDQFVLRPRGISVESLPRPIITGSDNFRPVGLAVAPDGSIYLTDWVLGDYKVHGQGRIWRVLSNENQKPARPLSSTAISLEAPIHELVALLDSPVLSTRRLAAKRLALSPEGRQELNRLRKQENIDSRRQFEVARAGVEYVEPAFYLDLTKDDLRDSFVLSKVINHTADYLVRIIQKTVRPTSTDDSLQQLIVEVGKLDPAVLERLPHEGEYCQIALLLALRKTSPKDVTSARWGLNSAEPSVRRLGVQWIGEEQLGELRPELERVLSSEPMTTELFMSTLASLSLLDGAVPHEFERTPPAQYMLAIVTDAARSPNLRAIALRMLPPTQPELDAKLIGEMLTSKERNLKQEAVRTLQFSTIPERNQLLRAVAADVALDANLRADAVAGLAGVDSHAQLDDATRDLLLTMSSSDKLLPIRLEAIRSLRSFSSATNDVTPRDAKVNDALKELRSKVVAESDAAQKTLAESLDFAIGPRKTRSVAELLAEFAVAPKNPGLTVSPPRDDSAIEAGRRTFYHPNGAGCFKCHRIGGRGGQIGPDLTVIARTMDRKKLAESILEPSKEISPQFTTWAIETKDGKTLTGLLLGEEVNGDLRMGSNLGDVFRVPFREIEARTPLKTSVMPEKLHELVTHTEFANLLAFLESLR